jgi:hypothetical protein
MSQYDGPRQMFERESKEKVTTAKTEALRALQEWAGDKEPISAVENLLKYHGPASEWLKEQLGKLTYQQIEEMADRAEDWEGKSHKDLEISRIAAELKRYVDNIVTPLVLIKKIGESLTEEQVEYFAEWIRIMMVGNSQNDVASIAEAAKRYSPDMIIDSRREYFAGQDQPEELHRTEEGTGPLLAASIKLRLGKKGVINISDDENNRGGLGNTVQVYAYIEK